MRLILLLTLVVLSAIHFVFPFFGFGHLFNTSTPPKGSSSHSDYNFGQSFKFAPPIPVESAASVLVLDINGNGIQLTALNTKGTVYWDADTDGFAEASAWKTPQNGLLAVDLNQDGLINNHAELIGDQACSNNPFLLLAYYDSNKDGVIDANDEQFDRLLVWIDAHFDGYSLKGELHSLTDLGITSISLAAADVSYHLNDNLITHQSSFTINEQDHMIVGAWLAYDDVNTVYAQGYTLNHITYLLPNLRGFGTLPSLRIAMSLNGNLLNMVSEIASVDSVTIYDPDFDIHTKILSIMYEWAGVSDIPLDSRGPNIDARMIYFVENFVGSPFLQRGKRSSPLPQSAGFVKTAFRNTFNNIYAGILAQTSAADIFSKKAAYNPRTGYFNGSWKLDLDMIERLVNSYSLSGSALENQWGDIMRLVEYTVGLKNLPDEDREKLDSLIQNSDIMGTLNLAFYETNFLQKIS